LIGPITGVYGSQRVYNGVPKNPHYGVDYAAPTGTEVVAPAAGIVRLAHPDLFYSGGTMIIDHGHGLSSSFLHLSGLLVAEGARVTRGQPIALVGATGRATGPHLDWRMNWHQQRIDPQLVLETLPSK
jgi:murein DD-endopeptidase MepM/ murein hydrolase activator NlpD